MQSIKDNPHLSGAYSEIRFKRLEQLAVQVILVMLLISSAHFAQAQQVPFNTTQEAKWLDLAQQTYNEHSSLASDLYRTLPQQKNWALALDNDIFVPGSRDQDYTYGINFTQSGPHIRDAVLSLNTPLQLLDSSLGFPPNDEQTEERYIRELGVFGFTPEDITIEAANPDDRPYASLVYLSSAREQIDWVNDLAWKSTLTLGLLGTNLAGNLQNRVHEYTNSTRAEGWENQISDGGELTARYLLARQQLLDIGENTELKSTLQISVGYLTEASAGISFRRGDINSSWASFNPDLTSYGEKASFDGNTKAINEHYFWGGIAVKARAYNAFLEGQFRESAVSYQRSELNSILVEAWLGYTIAFRNGYRLSYVLRGHTSEVRHGNGDRGLLWGSLILARAI
jgi:hypothetical protein